LANLVPNCLLNGAAMLQISRRMSDLASSAHGRGGARQAFDRLAGHDGALHDVLVRRGAPHVVSLLESAATAQPETLTRVGEFLMSLGVEPWRYNRKLWTGR
jgi:hypothetical protein